MHERALHERYSVDGAFWLVPTRPVGHLVELVLRCLELLHPKRFNALNRPRAVGAHKKDRIKVHTRSCAALHNSRDEQGLLARRVRKLRARQLGNAADDLGGRVALCAYWADEALAARAQARVARKHD